ncbi:homeodomain-interacting protein kinase 3-like [Archocentrus centrarchus]|uniref:homeodomain-interacting protein kinase 3-like n=1 Tax=Archocentrus centrarchus TaxID=63155 RepID=UPI0011EA1DF9|nr:homeodomain-interacting protein kinase 3-like [Archocentrus centrarchus]
MASNMYSNVQAQDEIVPGSRLTSSFSSYEVLSILGEGTFGKVAKCVRMADKKTVAIKVMKNYSVEVANIEVVMLYMLSMHNSHKHNMVEWYQAFMDRGHPCLEFEYLDKSLFDFMLERHFQPLSLTQIRPIVMQIAIALKHLKSIGIIHADLKLDNVMLVNHQQEPYRIKVIDFGLAQVTSAATVGSCLQTSPYRSPEIILGLPFTEAIDVWSLGIIAATLYLGFLLYPGYCEYEMMRYIVETQGKPEDKMLNSGQKTSLFFYKECNSTTSNWKLKTPVEVFQDTGNWFIDRRERKFTSLDDLLHLREPEHQNYADKVAEMADRLMFTEMIKELLQLDAETRITPEQVLDHPFAKMSHMASFHHLSSYVKSCYQHTEICKKNSPVSSDSRTGVSESLQQPMSETRQPAQQQLHPPAAESKILERPPSSRTTSPSQKNCPPPSIQRSRPNCSRPSHCETAQTVSVKPNFKRKHPDEDTKDTSQLVKRRTTDWKDVGEKIPPSSTDVTSDQYQKKFRYSPGPSCSTNRTQSSMTRTKRRIRIKLPSRARKRGPENTTETAGAALDLKDSRADDHRCREARGAAAAHHTISPANRWHHGD